MKVSILLITYNHSRYIRQCLEGIAIQRTGSGSPKEKNLELEIILADDCSTDNTTTIVRELAGTLQVPVTYLATERNLGFVQNYHRAFNACHGDYIAVIEGDDYWTDPDRLLKHTDFLENHPESVLSTNRFAVFSENNGDYKTAPWVSPHHHEYVDTRQLILHNKLGNLSACVFRRSEVVKLQPDLFDLEIADWMIGIVMSRNGSIAILMECMSVYRIHDKGQWSQMSGEEQIAKTITLIDVYNRYLGYEYDAEFNLLKKNLHALLNPPPVSTPRSHIFHRITGLIKRVVKRLLPAVIADRVKEVFRP